MDLNYSAEDLAFRDEVRTWIRANLPGDLRDKVMNYYQLEREDFQRWHRILADKGWIAPHWDEEWGGLNWTAVQRYILEEECTAAGCPIPLPTGVPMCGPVLLRFGTEEQKKRFLPQIYNGDEVWCQGYSEPEAGSDLAALKMSAVREGDHYILNGQKIWTSFAHYADWIFCLVRTDPQAPKKQLGISFILIDMKTPGITVRPLLLMSETHDLNEVFFENVKVPAENLVHKEDDGWTVAKFLLGYERLNTGEIGASKRDLVRLKELAASCYKNGKPLSDDPRFQDRVSRVEIELMALEVTNLRFLDQIQRGREIGAEVSLLKVRGTEIQQALTELMLDVAGPLAAPAYPMENIDFDTETANLAQRYCNYRKASIYAGSNEIQRNIIAKMSLGL